MLYTSSGLNLDTIALESNISKSQHLPILPQTYQTTAFHFGPTPNQSVFRSCTQIPYPIKIPVHLSILAPSAKTVQTYPTARQVDESFHPIRFPNSIT